jgi:hypothetical protein
VKQGEHPAEAVWTKDGDANLVWPCVAVIRDGELFVHLPDELPAKIDRDGGTFGIHVHRDAG